MKCFFGKLFPDGETQKKEKLYMQTFNLMIIYKLNNILAFLQIRGYQTFVVSKWYALKMSFCACHV